jgi:hypothetical protein
LAAEAIAAAVLGLSAVVYTRRLDFNGARAQRDLPGPRLAVADDLGAAVLVALLVAGM